MTQPLRAFEDTGKKRVGSHRGGAQQKYVMDDWQRRLLQERYDGRSETIDELMMYFPGIPRHKIRQWACNLGLARNTKDVQWSEKELHYLETNLHKMSLEDIARKLGRSVSAIRNKARRIGTSKTQEGYTLSGLCQGLGCDHKKIERWLDKGWIKGSRRKSQNKERDIWYFSDQSIRDFVKNHPEEIDLRRVDALWFLDVLTGGTHGIGELAF